MRGNPRLFSPLLLSLALIAGCGGDDSPAEPEPTLIGTWERSLGGGLWSLTFMEGGEFFATVDGNPDGVTGGYEDSGGMVTFTDDGCGVTVEGVYNYTFPSGNLQLSLVTDACSDRANVLGGTWSAAST